MTNILRILAVMLGGAISLGSQAQDAERGKLLYDTHCGGCHYERVHDRLRTKIFDLADLRDEVARWAPQTKHKFTLDEIEAVVQYVNTSHYRIGLPPREGKTPR
jgi:mono/diheme cytochrome c family protein